MSSSNSGPSKIKITIPAQNNSANSGAIPISTIARATTNDVQILHQSTTLNLEYMPPTLKKKYNLKSIQQQWGNQWSYKGTTTMYVIDHCKNITSSAQHRRLALHFRKHQMKITSVKVFAISLNPGELKQTNDYGKKRKRSEEEFDIKISENPYCLVSLSNVTHLHIDPMQKILRSPSPKISLGKSGDLPFEADAHSNRSGAGFGLSLRAATIACNDGECKVGFVCSLPTISEVKEDNKTQSSFSTFELVQTTWKQDLLLGQLSNGDTKPPSREHMLRNNQGNIQKRLHRRTQARRQQRMEVVSKKLAAATISWFGAYKLVITFEMEAPKPVDDLSFNQVPLKENGGIHFVTPPPPPHPSHDSSRLKKANISTHLCTPHVYTTTGSGQGGSSIFGNPVSGPRCWLPCFDSPSILHRCSHEFVVSVSAPMWEGLKAVVCGEDFCDKVDIHEHKDEGQSVSAEDDSGIWVATHTVASVIYEPIPPRCLGLAVGPFEFVTDPECLEEVSDEEEDEDEEEEKANTVETESEKVDEKAEKIESKQEDGNAVVDSQEAHKEVKLEEQISEKGTSAVKMRKKLRGAVRVAYFATASDRPYLHAKQQRTPPDPLSEAIRNTIVYSTSGVALRALSFIPIVLGHPNNQLCRIYTQVWIPHAMDGGYAVGMPHQCGSHNSWLGGCVLDARLLPPVYKRLPYYSGGRTLQISQARNVIWMWVKSTISIGSDVNDLTIDPPDSPDIGDVDEVGDGYLLEVFFQYLSYLYELAYGASGEGGSSCSMFYTARYAEADPRYPSLVDNILGMENVEEDEADIALGVVGNATVAGLTPGSDEASRSLYRVPSPSCSESRTGAMEECVVRSILRGDSVEALHRAMEKFPLPCMAWNNAGGSLLSLTYLASLSTNATLVGCGTMDATHYTQMLYREAKAGWFASVAAARAGAENLIRVIRACVLSGSIYAGLGLTAVPTGVQELDEETSDENTRTPRFVLVLGEMLKRGGVTHGVFTKALRLLAGPTKEIYLNGSLLDIGRDVLDARGFQITIPEGFPNSYVRGASSFYLRTGVHVEPASVEGGTTQAKGTHLQVFAEAAVPSDGIVFAGPITLRVVENENTCREFVRTLNVNGSLSQWGPIFLHSKPVTSAKAQLASSGSIEGSAAAKKTKKSRVSGPAEPEPELSGGSVFTTGFVHAAGYQSLELVRLTNRTPLLWCKIDPAGIYGGRIALNQPDACWGEMLFHDGDACGQIEAIRALAERPTKIQGSVNVTTIYDVDVAELPIRLLGDCLRGSAALHSSLPHPPVIRLQAALAIAQWQNNKAPQHRDDFGENEWLGLKLLLHYFKERFTTTDKAGNTIILPCKYWRETVQRNEGGDFQYMDDFDKDDEEALRIRAAAVAQLGMSGESFDDVYPKIEREEDEEYRVRAAVVTAIASIRAKDGQTPPLVIEFFEQLVPVCDGAVFSTCTEGGNLQRQYHVMVDRPPVKVVGLYSDQTTAFRNVDDLGHLDFVMVANTLLSLCYINMTPEKPGDLNDVIMSSSVGIDDIAPGIGAISRTESLSRVVSVKGLTKQQGDQPLARHPVQSLIDVCHQWLDWSLYQETTAREVEAVTLTGVGEGAFSIVAPSAITALSSLALLKQSTTKEVKEQAKKEITEDEQQKFQETAQPEIEETATAKFYLKIFDETPMRSDVTRAAAAQAIACVCCAADRNKINGGDSLGLLTALELLMDRVNDPMNSLELRQTLVAIMMDACTGKVCSTQRVASIGGRNDNVEDIARYLCGPLGSSHGGDNGSALFLTVSNEVFPAANAVNDGARMGLKLIMRAGLDSSFNEETVVRVAKFATTMWRTMNGEVIKVSIRQNGDATPEVADSICASDSLLRTSLLALWQWIWPKVCYSVMRVQSWLSMKENTVLINRLEELKAAEIMTLTEQEKSAASEEERALSELHLSVQREIERQTWRCEMSSSAYEVFCREARKDVTAQPGGVNQPLPTVKKDASWRNGGWVASVAQQRRDKNLDGGTSVTKLRLNVGKSSD